MAPRTFLRFRRGFAILPACAAARSRGRLNFHDQDYPFSWLWHTCGNATVSPELIYCHHERGFALFTCARTGCPLYLQCAPDEDNRQLADERIWQELRVRLGNHGDIALREGPVLQKGITTVRSFVAEPMQHGKGVPRR